MVRFSVHSGLNAYTLTPAAPPRLDFPYTTSKDVCFDVTIMWRQL